MKNIISLLAVLVLTSGTSLFAQTGRPEKIDDNAPKITARNSIDKDVATLREHLEALEKRIVALETENAAQQKQIADLNGAQKANYYVLNEAFSKLNTKFNTQVGEFIIKGLVDNNKLPPADQHILLGVKK